MEWGLIAKLHAGHTVNSTRSRFTCVTRNSTSRLIALYWNNIIHHLSLYLFYWDCGLTIILYFGVYNFTGILFTIITYFFNAILLGLCFAIITYFFNAILLGLCFTIIPYF